MKDYRKFYINGSWVDPIEGTDLPVINPANEKACAVISLGGSADTNAAVSAARESFPAWSETPLSERISVLERLLEIYKRRVDEMAEAISLEMGAPITMARSAQAEAGIEHIATTIEALRKFPFVSSVDGDSSQGVIMREAIGVTALITPWNWPMNQVSLKVAPALGAGCTMVLKPSEIAPLSSMLMAEIIDEAGVPPGVFNLVNGDGEGVGTQLSVHPDIEMVSFTGSTRAGSLITKAAADTIKRVCLELGGKGANIVFADADEKAVVRGTRHCFNNSGQSCNAPTRMLVENTAYDNAVQQAAKVANTTLVDQPSKDGRHIGPVVSEVQFNKIQQLIRTGIEEGATLIAGGPGRPEGIDCGYFVRPTVFADVTPDMTIAKQEIFGPVLSIMKFESEDEAISIANDTVYGLTNYVQTGNAERASRIARKLRSGMVEVNGLSLGRSSPFGGYRQSGNGRERGPWGLEEFLETKVVSAAQA